MADDLKGYQTDVSYPATLESRLTPAWMAAMTRLYGVRSPEPSGAFRMLDIGCGAGLGLALVAASHPDAAFEGIDGLSAHIKQGTAFASGISNITLKHQMFDQALAEVGSDCEFVTLHGVLSWVAPDIRAQALDVAAARLAPGGILGVSYNALPGRARLMAYQHLVNALAQAGTGGPASLYQDAHARVKNLVDHGFKALSGQAIAEFEEHSAQVDPAYFPHEFLNSHWQPLWGSTVQAQIECRGLSFVGQNSLVSLRPDLTVPKVQREIIEAEQDPMRRDMLLDMAMNTPFRIDLYTKDPVPAAPEERAAIWLAADADAGAELAIGTPAGKLRYDNPAARGVLSALQDGPMSLGALSAQLGTGLPDIVNAGTCLVIGNRASFCAPRADSASADQINSRLSDAALRPDGPPLHALAGACGPVRTTPPMIGLLHTQANDIISAAKESTVVFDRFFHEGVDLDLPDAMSDLSAVRRGALLQLSRLGVPTPTL